MKKSGLLLAIVYLLPLCITTECVIVDGVKKKEFSPTIKQSSAEESIDAYNTKTCGIYDQNYDEHEFINMAREGQFPWIVSFQIKIPKDGDKLTKRKLVEKALEEDGDKLEDLHFCSGSFISDRWILSAAHCFSPTAIKSYLENGKLKAVAGSNRVSSRTPVNRNLTIERIYYHSKFDNEHPIGFDVSLVELRDPVKFTQSRNKSKKGEQNAPFINTICLPLKDKAYKFNETARVAGWGMSNEKDITSMPTKLLTTDILLSNVTSCANDYSERLNSTKPLEQLKNHDDFLCAGYKNFRDTCQSDSGGPLMQYSDGKAVVIGIVSFGIGCATEGIPGFYTRTSAYIDWIKDVTKNGKYSRATFKLIESNHKLNQKKSSTLLKAKMRKINGPKKRNHSRYQLQNKLELG